MILPTRRHPRLCFPRSTRNPVVDRHLSFLHCHLRCRYTRGRPPFWDTQISSQIGVIWKIIRIYNIYICNIYLHTYVIYIYIYTYIHTYIHVSACFSLLYLHLLWPWLLSHWGEVQASTEDDRRGHGALAAGFPWPWGRTPHSWMFFLMGNPTKKWMMTWGTPISRNTHIYIYIYIYTYVMIDMW